MPRTTLQHWLGRKPRGTACERGPSCGAWGKTAGRGAGMGGLARAVLDRRVVQKLVVAPVTRTNKECFKVLVRPDGSEYLLLESGARRGLEKDLRAEGLLIWRVVHNRPVLEESH